MAGGFCPDVLPTRDEIEWNKRLSTRLYRIMENTDATTEVRDIRKETASLIEILLTICGQPDSFYYLFGSRYEGTFTFDENYEADVDKVFTDNGKPVATNISNCPHPICYLLLPDKQPGYFKLQLTVHGKPIENYFPYPSDPMYCLKSDKDQRLCLIQKPDFPLLPDTKRQGPALHTSKSILITSIPEDTVYALKGEDWPDCASEWVTRQRDNGWPSKDLIMKCKTLGFLMVYTCHPASDEKEFQWRISFSLQERLLVTQFNSVQLKCYMLLKLIKKKIQAEVKEETLTSYHCKTCMLYMLENTPTELWIPQNLLTCLLMCLRQLLIYVRNNNCPNYFIPGENMFDRITSGKLREKLGQVLDRMLNPQANLFDYLTKQIIHSSVPYLLATNNYELSAKVTVVLDGCQTRMRFLFLYYNKSLRDFQNHLTHKLRQIEKATTITEHTKAETDQAKSLILPFIRVHLLSCHLVSALSARTEAVQDILLSKEWEQQVPTVGYSKLKQAAAMLMLRHYETAIDVLLSIRDIKKFSCCSCDPVASFPPTLDELLKAVGNRPHITVTYLLNDLFQPCVIFLPLEQEITPPALQYETVRDFGKPPSSDLGYNIQYFWHTCGVVEGNFLLHFLLHLNYQALGENSKAIYHVKKMICLLNSKSVSHRETCYNLLGWAHKERGDITRAVECYRKSLETAFQHNAACWHLCFLICGY